MSAFLHTNFWNEVFANHPIHWSVTDARSRTWMLVYKCKYYISSVSFDDVVVWRKHLVGKHLVGKNQQRKTSRKSTQTSVNRKTILCIPSFSIILHRYFWMLLQQTVPMFTSDSARISLMWKPSFHYITYCLNTQEVAKNFTHTVYRDWRGVRGKEEETRINHWHMKHKGQRCRKTFPQQTPKAYGFRAICLCIIKRMGTEVKQ